jgi:hypothetical protein
MRTLIAIAVLSVPAAAVAEPFDLFCSGAALHAEAIHTPGSVRTDDGRSPAGDEGSTRDVRSAGSVRVRISAAGAGRIKPPAALTPPSSDGGRDGWWDLSDVVVTADAIRGQYALNMFNHPKVLIDRHTGDIDIKGWGLQFNGTCDRAPVAPETPRKF